MAYPGESYRTYALDILGFIESGQKRKSYAVQDPFMHKLKDFLDEDKPTA